MTETEITQAEAVNNNNQQKTDGKSSKPGLATDSIRERFAILEHKAYLNSCSQGALSNDVRQAYQAYLDGWDEKGSPWDYWVERMETARQVFAGLINAQPDEVSVQNSVTTGVAALASALDFSGERNKIVTSDFAFPTVAQLWHAQERHGAEVVHVRAAGNIIPTQRFAEAIDERTKLVSITHVCFRNGSRLDVPAIVELAHSKGALVLLDSYQALGSIDIDVKELGVDFLVGGVLKYLLSSSGLAYLYVRKELLPRMVSTTGGWFAQENIFDMDIYAHKPHPSARRFDGGSPPVPNIYAAIAGMKLIESIGMPKIEKHIRMLTDAIKQESMRRGFNLVSPIDPARHGALITLRSTNPDILVSRLAEDDVITSYRDNNLRISPHIYNNLDDIERLMAALSKNRDLLV